MSSTSSSSWIVVAEWPAAHQPLLTWVALWRHHARSLYAPGPALAAARRGLTVQLARWAHDATPLDWPRLCASLALVGVPGVTAFVALEDGTSRRFALETCAASTLPPPPTTTLAAASAVPLAALVQPLPGFAPDAVLCAPALPVPSPPRSVALAPVDACRVCTVSSATVVARPCDCLLFCAACAPDYYASPFHDLCPACQQTVAWFEPLVNTST